MAIHRSDATFRRVRELTTRLVEFGLSDVEKAEFERLLAGQPELRDWYIDHIAIHGMLRYTHLQPLDAGPGGADRGPAEIDLCQILLEESSRELPPAPDVRPPILGFLGDVFRAGGNFLSRSFVLTLLLTVGLPAILLTILLIQIGSEPHLKPPAAVATISRTYRCVWEDGGAPANGFDLPPGERIRLREGLVELAFTGGAKAILQGPATFEAASGARGFLRAGSLVANVPKGSGGFTVRTPAITVVDLGTEFGVRVERQQKAAEVEVFQGKVELHAASKQSSQTIRHPLVAGQAASIEVADRQDALPVIRPIAPLANAFVRQMPGPIVADFSGGAGDAQPDQFPGAAGSGWATGWDVGVHGERKQLSCVTAIEESSPLLGGGEYLRVLAERKAGNPDAEEWTAIDRRLAVTDVVDLTKPHVVAFNLRIDSLAPFTKAGDRLSICVRNVEQSRFILSDSTSSGWHVCMVGQGSTSEKLARSTNWCFLHRDDKGRLIGTDSGITPREGSTYSFRILVDPPALRWTPSIAVDGGKWTKYEAMGMRSKGSAKKNKYWPYLNLFCQLQGSSTEGDVERIGFSVDSIRITAPQTDGAE